MIRKTSITPMCSSRPTPSSTSSVSPESPSSSEPTAWEPKAPLPYGRLPWAAAAPRKRNIVHTTLKIMNSTIQAPPRWEPLKRDLRPSLEGACCSRILAKTARPITAMIAMKSCTKPSRSHVPMIGIANGSG